MTDVERLQIVIEANSTQVQTEIAKINNGFNSINNGLSKTQNSLNKGLSQIKAAVATAFSVIAVVRFGKSMLDTADNLKTMSAQTGLSTSRIQELQYAVGQTGGSVDMLKRGIQTMSEQISAGNPELAKMGVTTTDAGKAFDQVLIKLADMGDTAERNALGQQLLGRSFVELKPLLAEGSAGIADLTAAAHTNGAVMSSELVNGLDRLGDSLATLKSQLIGAFYPILTFVLPVLQSMISGISYAVGFITGMIQAIFGMSKTIEKSTTSTGAATAANNSLAESAAAVKRAYSGFDELNVVTTPTSGSTASPITSGSFGSSSVDGATKALEDAAKASAKFNEAIAKGITFWDKWGESITVVSAIIAALIAGNQLYSFYTGIITGLGTMNAAWGAAYLVMSAGATSTGWLCDAFLFLQTTVAEMIGTFALFTVAIAVVIATFVQLYTEASVRGNTFRNNIEMVFMGIKDTFNKFWEQIKPVWEMFLAMLIFVWENGVKPLWDGWVNFVAALVNLIAEILLAFKPLVDFLISVFGPAFQVVAEIVIVVFGFLAATIGQVIGTILDILAVLIGWIGNVLVTGIKGAIAFIISYFGNWYATVKEVIDNIKQVFNGVVQFVTGVFSGNWKSAIAGLSSAFDGVVGAVTAPFKLAFNAIADMWNKTLGGFKVDFLGFKFTVPTMQKWTSGIPQLAAGGSLDAGSLFVAGESGAEMMGSYNGKTTVMPLENTSFVGAMKQAMVEGMTQVLGASSDNGNRDIILSVDGMQWAKATVKNLNKLATIQGGLNLAD